MSRGVLIVGAGYVGIELGLELVRDGHAVFGLRRNVGALPAAIRPLRADLADPASWPALPEAIDDVVYAVAAKRSDPEAYRLAYVDGLSRLLDRVLAGRRRPRRVLFTSSTAVYAQQNGERVDELSQTEPANFAGRLLLEAERLLLDAGLPAVVLRLGGIYGPGRTRLIEQVRAGTLRARGGIVNRVHQADCAGAIRHVLGLVEPAPCYVVVDDEPAPQQQVAAFIAERLGLSPPGAVLDAQDAGRRGERSSKRCSNRLLKSTGYALRWPTYREGYAALL